MAHARQAPIRTTAPVHIHWKAIVTYKALYRSKGGNELTIYSVRKPPPTKVFRAPTGRKKYKLVQLTTSRRKVIILAKTKSRKKPVETEELEEIEALEELEELEEEEEEDEDVEEDEDEDEDEEDEDEPDDEDEDDEEEEDEEPAPKKSKKSAKAAPAKKAAKKPQSRAAAEGKVGTQEVAAHFGTDGRSLRMLLRKHSIAPDPDSGRYQWSSLNHPQVKKIGQLIGKGEHKKAAREGLDKLKAKKAADKTSTKKGAKKKKHSA